MAYQLIPLVLLIFFMYFLLIRPQKKREKAVNEMRSNIKVGDEIVTIGGICGKVVKVKDETIVIQVGAEKLKFEMMKWSVSKVVNSDPAKASPKKQTAEEPEETNKKALPKKLRKPEAVEEKAPEAAPETASTQETETVSAATEESETK